MAITHDSFNPVLLDLFWKFLAERQRVWVRRVKKGLPAPWTHDKVMQEEHFTNVYRELDPGTEYVFRRFLDNARLSPEERAWHIMNYRLVGSNRFVYHRMFPVHLRRWDADEYRAKMHAAADVGEKVWGAAYTVTGAVCAKGESKIDAIGRVINDYTKDFPALYHEMAHAPTMEASYKTINGVYGFGPFLAYQSLIDMVYTNASGESVLPWDPNEWATLGLGAKEGIARIMARKENPLEVLRWLVANQESEFERVGERFAYLKNHDGTRRTLTLQSFQTCLCEFWKWSRRAYEGQGASRKFVSAGKLHVPDYVA